VHAAGRCNGKQGGRRDLTRVSQGHAKHASSQTLCYVALTAVHGVDAVQQAGRAALSARGAGSAAPGAAPARAGQR